MSERKIPRIKYLDKLSPVDTAVIEIQEGKYKGVQYFYEKVDLKDVENFRLKFDYNITEGKVEDEKDFINTIGDILTQIVSQDIEHRLEKDT
jgi:hypothetical protein